MSDETPISGKDYGQSLTGFGVSLIVSNMDRAVLFATEVLGATVYFRTSVFAAMKLYGQDFMFHTPTTYRGNELYPTLVSDAPRGVGIELRCYHTDPDQAEAVARARGFTILAGAMDKTPHGLRECMILDDDGFVWIPSRHLT